MSQVPYRRRYATQQVVLKKKISIFFCVFLWFKPRTSILSYGCHFVHRGETVLAIFVEGHLSNILMEVECNKPRGIGGIGI